MVLDKIILTYVIIVLMFILINCVNLYFVQIKISYVVHLKLSLIDIDIA